jgi:hypothetical protein
MLFKASPGTTLEGNVPPEILDFIHVAHNIQQTECVNDELFLELEVEGRVGGETGTRVHLDQPRSQFRVKQNVETYQ